MNAPDHTLESDGAGNFIVKVGQDVAGTIAKDHQYTGLWGAWDQDGQFMGRVGSKKDAAALLAAWFVSEEQDWL
ncbi:hypothetical protein MEX01_45670 [Methylorubrum extorquens]|uniref:hypothetical protein n=1 Tax=Methylorubrum extorquens TaxID=408 RepID=UPI001167A18B|nr:hypothetical protein [Methylorubrum extorquens]GEL43976.1 hypothetical protein MEX01_45670 [Methylorubrum extorquens]